MTAERDDANEIEGVDEDVDVFDQPVNEDSPIVDSTWAVLPLTTLLEVEDADELLRWRAASVVAVVGERNGGKTTLVAEIYERFLQGPFAEKLFASSWSLSGFEIKSFQSRAESGATSPDTLRTSVRDGLRFFHLAVADVSTPQERRDLLISERAGETYREIRDNPKRSSEMIELRRAAAIAFIVDGERVRDDLKRAEVFASVRNIIRALHETRTISPTCRVQVVTTKFDLLNDDEAIRARDALTEFEQRLTNLYSSFYTVEVFRTAARDPKGVVEPAMGVAPLFRSWLERSPLVKDADLEIPVLTDECDRLLLRRKER
ncbi:TRAFAC clade GTPase domain-containing protein [Pseudomonas syringae]|uniref:TRAFAC clade GTPase domain-containing protein n=1 Tax=Pseudomonas syringae TaxID=317 RepID=UPI002FCD9ADE